MYYDPTSYFTFSLHNLTEGDPVFVEGTSFYGIGSGAISANYTTIVADTYELIVDCSGENPSSRSQTFEVLPSLPTVENSSYPLTFRHLIAAEEDSFSLVARDIYNSIYALFEYSFLFFYILDIIKQNRVSDNETTSFVVSFSPEVNSSLQILSNNTVVVTYHSIVATTYTVQITLISGANYSLVDQTFSIFPGMFICIVCVNI